MSKTRREIMTLATSAAVGLLAHSKANAAAKIKAIAFDGFAIIDPRPVAARADELFPGQGKSLMEVWRAKQFGYAWLRTMGDRYEDFWRVTEDALQAAAGTLGLNLDAKRRDRLMQVWLELRAWPDAGPTLNRLKQAGIKLAFLSNFTAPMLEAAVTRSNLQGLLEPHLSSDLVRAYKPDPRAYRMALDAFSLMRDEIVFVAFAGWDVAGAKWFGYRTYWANRAGARADHLGATADAEAADLSGLQQFVGARA